ncbi:lactoylglutathione lyase [Fervidicella metallireducens AeB]|uniref:Lactoylglutathione lyase n=1 Tax=Fervidicella metallireducens AeB TaxID=1403537 RepID=A0A017RXE2_9CLOT|nr:VOC family protein [Fervidicella metallireducens]EYE89448.1 lactoylglutathione lyase [Fervidicella metallireducens AeB]
MDIHHIGYIVNDIKAAEEKFKVLGFLTGEIIEDIDRKIKIELIKNENIILELIQPSGEGSPVSRLLKRNGSIPYHICYECENIKATIENLEREGFLLIQEPKSAVAFENKEVAFLYSEDIGLIEIKSRK